MAQLIFAYVCVFLYGIIIGSFLNVCIYRIPKNESVVTEGSHCMACGRPLKWRDMVPVFSWLILHGKCRFCGEKISIQYPLVELANGLLYLLIFFVNGVNPDSAIYSVMTSAMLVISVIDFRTMKIPIAADVVIFAMGVVHLLLHLDTWYYYVIGFFFASLFLLLCSLLFRILKNKNGMGAGDIELMACTGLCIGWGHALFAIALGSVIGSVIEGTRMAVTKKSGRFAFGPYLCLGVFIAMLWGTGIYEWYINTFIY